MVINIDIQSAKKIKTRPVHQWDTMVELRFSDPVDTTYKLHVDEPDGVGQICDLTGLTHPSCIIPNDFFGTNFDGDVVCHLVKIQTLAEYTVCDIIIPVIPRQKAEAPR